MSLWGRTLFKQRDTKRSEALASEIAKLEASWGDVQAEIDRVDSELVTPAAERLSIVMYTHNQQKILECREALSKAIWKRDALRNDFSRRLDELKADLETLTVPVIADKAEKWQKDLSALQGQRLVEQIETFRDKGNDKLPKLVRFKSNFAVINEAREALTAAIRELRAMRTRPLPEIWTFIEAQEARLRLFDFGVLVEAAQPVPESTFAQLAEGPEMLIRPKDGEIARAFEIYFDPGAPAGGRPHTKRGK